MTGTMHIVLYTLYYADGGMHIALFNMHNAHCTVQYAQCTLHHAFLNQTLCFYKFFISQQNEQQVQGTNRYVYAERERERESEREIDR